MQARLAFGIATTMQPEVLIIDEVLGAGDAYFFAKSAARMRELLGGGASVFLVSHALDQIARFCDETIWLDRGRTVMRGATMDVIKAYEKFIRQLDDRRLHAKNEKTRLETFDGFERDSYTDHFGISFTTTGELDVAEIALVKDGEQEDVIAVGSPQDAAPTQSGHIVIDPPRWRAPDAEGERYFRTVDGTDEPEGQSISAGAVFYAWFIYPDARYSLDVTYRLRSGEAQANFGRSGRIEVVHELAAATSWRKDRIEMPTRGAAPMEGDDHAERGDDGSASRRQISRWSGVGSLSIRKLALLDERDRSKRPSPPTARCRSPSTRSPKPRTVSAHSRCSRLSPRRSRCDAPRRRGGHGRRRPW